MPPDIQPTATDKPLGVVYDYDGLVTNALLGIGAGNSDQCFSNAVFGGPDAFTTSGNFAHALIVLNGNCIRVSTDLLAAKYRLMRVLGSVLGLDWSQLNLNVITGIPHHATADDQAGFALMHPLDLPVCVPITLCYPDPDHLRMDDRAAISRLYPVTAGNAAQFPGKQTLADNTVRIHGVVTFTDSNGNPTQGMQSVNVVARWIDPTAGQPSGRYAASAISGFSFRGNSGNTITGVTDPTGQRYDRFGSTDPALQGFSIWLGWNCPGVRPPSTSFRSNRSTRCHRKWSALTNRTRSRPPDRFHWRRSTANSVWTCPRIYKWREARSRWPTTPAAIWTGTPRCPSRTCDYFWMNGQANRTMAVEVTAQDETEKASESKARLVLGMWSLSDPAGTAPSAFSTFPFSIGVLGTTRVSVQVLSPGPLRIGISDLRGDGRPDFAYTGHVLYGDSASPIRLSVRGGSPLSLQGVGFKPGMTVSIGNALAPVLASSANRILAITPALSDSVQSLTITDPVNGTSSSCSTC